MKHTANRPYHLHGIRVLLFGVLLTALFLVRVDAPVLSARSDNSKVLAYSTSVSRTDLLNEANAYRAQNGLAPLTLNAKLNNSSQAKAQHMIDYDYWAHVAPDGTQPWYFFDQAGYSYQTAGENLAYGFDTSAAITTAWMNSTTHRANVLGNFVDVGFGYVNGANYQGGQYTVVVAHYGTTSTPAPAPAPAPVTPVPPAVTPAPTAPVTAPQTTTPTPVAAEPATTTPVPEEPAKTELKPAETPVATVAPVATGTAKSISLLESLKMPNPPMVAIASIMMTTFAVAGYALTHRSLVHHAVAGGEKFIVMHPALDTFVIAAISILILTTTISRIN